ncbi:unnamed protein product [Polarella glacialis]|uniref:Uncharacterized protein n=1 Tax=Polarella glacialis TaxID=89957 RepID=A0A813HSY6_POLGL|nr:unnamed protein product [Polarella glacialis]
MLPVLPTSATDEFTQLSEGEFSFHDSFLQQTPEPPAKQVPAAPSSLAGQPRSASPGARRLGHGRGLVWPSLADLPDPALDFTPFASNARRVQGSSERLPESSLGSSSGPTQGLKRPCGLHPSSSLGDGILAAAVGPADRRPLSPFGARPRSPTSRSQSPFRSAGRPQPW